eukprot:scaffold910_cov396-Prasinococcus_capsulatus_cf.AAC.41
MIVCAGAGPMYMDLTVLLTHAGRALLCRLPAAREGPAGGVSARTEARPLAPARLGPSPTAHGRGVARRAMAQSGSGSLHRLPHAGSVRRADVPVPRPI